MFSISLQSVSHAQLGLYINTLQQPIYHKHCSLT